MISLSAATRKNNPTIKMAPKAKLTPSAASHIRAKADKVMGK